MKNPGISTTAGDVIGHTLVEVKHELDPEIIETAINSNAPDNVKNRANADESVESNDKHKDTAMKEAGADKTDKTQFTPQLFSLLQRDCKPHTQVQIIRSVIASQYLPIVKDSNLTFTDLSSKSSAKGEGQIDLKESGLTSSETIGSEENDAKRTSTLQFPPCLVCGGKASGMHYGVNSCEACKGFFRRFLIRNQEYRCAKGGNCRVININRGNCSGCRLQRCLELGMAKENSKLGRYTLARRTQTIETVNKLEGKEAGAATKSDQKATRSRGRRVYPVQFQAKKFVCQTETDSTKIKQEPVQKVASELSDMLIQNNDTDFTDDLVQTLVRSMDEIKPYGPLVCTDTDVNRVLDFHIERYKKKVALFGHMKSIPKDEYYKLYQEFGIDIDNRMSMLRETAAYIESQIDNYCNFAKNIPNFSRLSFRDQCNLLKSSRCDFFIILMHESCRSHVCIMHNGVGYHQEEIADKFFSRKLIVTVCDMYKRWQKLSLTRDEKAILIALTIVFTDRCHLDDHALVEEIQLSLVELLRRQLEITDKSTAQRRFLKIIDYLTLMRESSEMYLKEYKLLCKDNIVVEECPMITEFLFEDW